MCSIESLKQPSVKRVRTSRQTPKGCPLLVWGQEVQRTTSELGGKFCLQWTFRMSSKVAFSSARTHTHTHTHATSSVESGSFLEGWWGDGTPRGIRSAGSRPNQILQSTVPAVWTLRAVESPEETTCSHGNEWKHWGYVEKGSESKNRTSVRRLQSLRIRFNHEMCA